jgi:hypothetical protein
VPSQRLRGSAGVTLWAAREGFAAEGAGAARAAGACPAAAASAASPCHEGAPGVQHSFSSLQPNFALNHHRSRLCVEGREKLLPVALRPHGTSADAHKSALQSSLQDQETLAAGKRRRNRSVQRTCAGGCRLMLLLLRRLGRLGVQAHELRRQGPFQQRVDHSVRTAAKVLQGRQEQAWAKYILKRTQVELATGHAAVFDQ